jgi:hypothetical protein
VCLLKRRARDSLARDERRFVADPSSNTKLPRLVMCIGIAGTGVGFRRRGYLRYGDRKSRAVHRRYATVAMKDEFRISQTCSTCFCPIIHPSRVVVVNGKKESRR